MSRSVLVAIGLTVACAGYSSSASAAATPKWEKQLLERYVNRVPCTGKGAPAWGKASMARWRARQHDAKRYDAY